MKKILGLMLLFFCVKGALGQCVGNCTTVTATLQDSAGQTWSFATVSINLIRPFGNPSAPLNNGVGIASPINTVTANSSGVFTISLDDNSKIFPTGTRWNFNVCPNATVANCSQILLFISGATQNVSTSLNAGLIVPTVNTAPSVYRAYNDAEALGGQGNIYWNTISNTLRGCTSTPCVWSPIGGGGGGTGTLTNFSSDNLSPLFTTTVNNPTSTPTQSFTLSQASAFTVYSNLTNASANPQFNVVQGTDSKLLTSGTVSGTSVGLCTDANGGATTTGCTVASTPASVYFENCSTDQTGNVTYNNIAQSNINLSVFQEPVWQFTPGQASYINCIAYIPTAQTGATIVLDIFANDAGVGHTANFYTCDGLVTNNFDISVNSCAASQTFTTNSGGGAQYARVTLTYNVQSTLSNGSYLFVKIGTTTTGTQPTAPMLVYAHFII